MKGLQHNVRVMAYCPCRVQGSNVLCLAVPQPRPELRFAGPYVLQAPLVQVPNVSSVFLTRDNHMHASSASFMHMLENMTKKELSQGVKTMERELDIPPDRQVPPFNINEAFLVMYVEDILIPKKNEVLENKKQELDNLFTQWRILMANLDGEEYRLYDEFQFERFGPLFFDLVEKTQTCLKSMKDQQGFEESFFFGNKLVDLLHQIHKKLEIASNLQLVYVEHRRQITRPWWEYLTAGKSIFVSLRDLQTKQEEIIRELTLESVHFGQHTKIQPMLTTLIRNVQTCANMLLDADVWNREQKWMFEEVEDSRKFDFWMLRSDSPIARFSKSLRALIEEMINVLMQQRRQELDSGAKGWHLWTHLLDTLKSFQFTVNIHRTHPQIENFGTEITFFVLARKSNWAVWMRANAISPSAIGRLADLVTKMTGFCSFFIVILNDLKHKHNTISWDKCISQICQQYSDALANSSVLDNLRKIE